jgi:hypothetical protein
VTLPATAAENNNCSTSAGRAMKEEVGALNGLKMIGATSTETVTTFKPFASTNTHNKGFGLAHQTKMELLP